MVDGPPRFGPPPQLDDVGSYFRWALATHKGLSMRGVAEELSLARETVRRIMNGADSRYSNVAHVLRHVQEHVEGARVGPEAPVGRIATSPIVTAAPEQSARELAELMATRALKLVPLGDTEDPSTVHDLEGLIERGRLRHTLVDRGGQDLSVQDVASDLELLDVRSADHRTACEEVATMLDEGPEMVVVTRLGNLEGVVTPDNMWRVSPD